MSRRPPGGRLRRHAPVVGTWLVGVVLGFAVQMGEGLGRPSEGLALSVAALPALGVALVPGRGRRRAAMGMVGLLGILALVNAVYHRAFDTWMPVQAVLSLDQGWAMRSYAAALFRAEDLVVLLVVGVALAGLALDGARGRGPPVEGAVRTPRLSRGLCLLAALPALGWAWWWAPTGRDHDTGGFLYSHLVDLRILAAEVGSAGPPTPAERTRVQRWRRAHPRPSPASDPWFGAAAGSSVLMVQVEALGGWLLEAEIGGEPVMPVLRSLADRGLHFTGVFDQTHLGRSSDADHLVMTSQHPLERAALAMARPGSDPPGLGDVLQSRGYATLSAHAHHRAFWNAGPRRTRYGFDTLLFDRELGAGETLGFGLTDEAFFRRMAPEVAALPRPWLAWLVTLTMHGPYPPAPASLSDLPLDTLAGTALGGYYDRAHHLDTALGALLGRLDGGGALENTLVVVYGDHPQDDFLDPGRVDRLAGVEAAAPGARSLLRDRVPVVVRLPEAAGDGPRGDRTIPRVGGLIDLGPTLLHLLGVPLPASFHGRPLTAPGEGFVARASGEAVASDRMWTGAACFPLPPVRQLEDGACDGIRRRAREELEVSWIANRMDPGV